MLILFWLTTLILFCILALAFGLAGYVAGDPYSAELFQRASSLFVYCSTVPPVVLLTITFRPLKGWGILPRGKGMSDNLDKIAEECVDGILFTLVSGVVFLVGGIVDPQVVDTFLILAKWFGYGVAFFVAVLILLGLYSVGFFGATARACRTFSTFLVPYGVPQLLKLSAECARRAREWRSANRIRRVE